MRARLSVRIALVVTQVLGAAYLLFVMGFRLGEFPGLHGDEAYFGLAALHFLEHGLESPHAANHYTGPIQALYVAGFFHGVGPTVTSLRLPGLVANGLSLLVLGVIQARFFGLRRSGLWLLVLAASPLQLYYARIAWEVSALQNLFLAALLWTVVEVERRPGPSPMTVLLFLCAAWLGVTSHFIFLAVLVAVALGTVLLADREPIERVAPWATLAAVGLGLGALLLVLKPRLTVDHWLQWRLVWVGLWLMAPVVGSRLVLHPTVVQQMTRALERLRPLLRPASLVLVGVSGLWFVFSGLGLGLLDVMAGPPLHMRFAAFTSPWIPCGLSYLAAAVVLLVAGRGIVDAGLSSERQPLRCRWLALCVLVWPLAMLCSGAFKTSMRYYLSVLPLFSWALVDVVERARPRIRRLAVASLATGAALTTAMWIPLTQGWMGPPEEFRIGNRRESSRHFLRVDSLLSEARRTRACDFEGEHFLVTPLRFLFLADPYLCDPTQRLRVQYCDDCAAPPYVTSEVMTTR